MGKFWKVVDMDGEEKALKERLERMRKLDEAAKKVSEQIKKK